MSNLKDLWIYTRINLFKQTQKKKEVVKDGNKYQLGALLIILQWHLEWLIRKFFLSKMQPKYQK